MFLFFVLCSFSLSSCTLFSDPTIKITHSCTHIFTHNTTDKGFVGTLLREVPGTAAWFGMYELSLQTLCNDEQDEEPKSWQVILAGGAGGMGYWGAFYPADTVKTEMQTLGNSTSKAPSFVETFRNIYYARGIRGLYAGLGPTLARAVPANAAVFYVYDVVSRQMLRKKG